MKSSYRHADIILRILLLAILLVILIAWLNPAYWNWAILGLDLISPFNIVLLALITALVVVPVLNRTVYNTLVTLLRGFSKAVKGLHFIPRMMIWIIIPAILLYLLRSNSYILGDGHLILSNTVEDKLISPTAIGFSLLVKTLARLFDISTELQAARLISGISILSGVIFLYFLNAILRILITNDRFRPIMFLTLACSGLIILFTGYIETYPILIAWLTVFLYSALRLIRGDFNPALLIIIFAIGVFWHIWFIAFLPSLLYSLNRRYRLYPGRVIIILAILFICGIYIAGRFLLRSDIPITIPLIPTQQSGYFMFSPLHLLDILNHLIIVGPIMTFAAFVFLIYALKEKITDTTGMLIYAALPSLAIAFICDPVLGAVRDWDLLAIYALPLMLIGAVLFWHAAQKDRASPKIILPIILIGLIHLSGLIINNKNAEVALDRAIRVLDQDPHYQSNYYDGRRAIPFSAILSNIYNRHDLGTGYIERALTEIDSGKEYLALANQYYNAGDWEKACRYYRMVPQDVHMNTKNHFTFAQSLFNLKEYKDATEQLEIALDDTLETTICILLGNCLLEQQMTDSAQKYYDLGLSLSSDSLWHMFNIARILYDKNENQAALLYCRRIRIVDSKDVDLMILMGQIHKRLGNSDSTFTYYSHALDQDSTSYTAAASMASYYYQKKDLPQALDILRRAERVNPGNPDIPFKIGYMLKVMSRGDEAVEAFRRALRIDPGHLQARHFMAEVYIDMNLPDSALKHWDSALAINSSFVPGYFGQARAYDILGNSEMAKKSLEICLRLNPQIDLDPDAKELLKKYDLGD